MINALERNGVSFSPLMLSRRKNIFIENQFKAGQGHKNFFLKFFSKDNLPNIIPIGNSGNVQDSDSFTSIFQDILNASTVSSVGIRDGDMWFKFHLSKYLRDQLTLPEILKKMELQKGGYIQDEEKNRSFYFNFWEIENLYLKSELLLCWKRNGTTLTKETYKEILDEHGKPVIRNEYFGAFYKSLTRIRISSETVQGARDQLSEKFQAIDHLLNDCSGLETKMTLLVESILSCNLLSWVPGKEIYKLILRHGYEFDDTDFDFLSSEVSQEIRDIQNYM